MCTTANNREIIEPRIIQLVRELTAAPATDEVADALKPVMEQVVDQAASSSQGGKRLRALLALDAFDILAGDVTPDRRDAMIDLACAIEVFQTAALVHDDIIDESDLRRGRPPVHPSCLGTGRTQRCHRPWLGPDARRHSGHRLH